MKLTDFFPWKKAGAVRPLSSTSLDQRLVLRVHEKKVPTWSQLKYLFHFLNKVEKRLFVGALLVAAFSLGTSGTLTIAKHSLFLPKSGGEYSEALIGQPKNINPLFASQNDVDADISALVYSGLFRYDSNGQLVPDLASGYTVSSDQKTYDITLRKDVTWSDGEPFTADDVVYTFNTIDDPETASPLISAFQGVKVEMVDATTVRFTLPAPFAPFLSSLTVGILPEHIWSAVSPAGIRLAKNNLQPVGTGPWQFYKLTKDDIGNIKSYILNRNQHYYGKEPYLNTVRFDFFNSYDDALEAVRSQEVAAVSFLPSDLQNKIKAKNFSAYSFKLPQYTALFFNQNHASLLKNDGLRQALAVSIDKNALFATLHGNADIINGPIPEGSIGYDANASSTPFSIENANALLDKISTRIDPQEYFKIRHDTLFKEYAATIDAMKKDASTTPDQVTEAQQKIEDQITAAVRSEMGQNQPFYRKDKDGNLFRLTITTADTPEYTTVAHFLAQSWNQIGIETTIETINSRQIEQHAIRNRDYDILLYGEIIGRDPDPYPFWHSSQSSYPGLNLAQFSNHTADKLLEDARGTTDTNKQADDYTQFQNILQKELPAVFLYTPRYSMIMNREVKGVDLSIVNSPSDRFNNLSDWYTKTSWHWH